MDRLFSRRKFFTEKGELLCVQGDNIQHDLGAAVHPLHGGAFAHAMEVEAAGAQIGAGQTVPA